MSLTSCVTEALEKGRITREQAEQLLVESTVPESQIIKGAIEGKILQRRQAALQAITLDKAIKDARGHEKGLSTGVMSLIVRDITGKAKYTNIDARGLGIFGDYQRELADMLDAYRSKLGGLTQDKKGVRNLVRELYGESSGNEAASAFAKAWSIVSNKARIRFNRAGGNIRKKKDWRLPQHHDPLMVKRTGFGKWVSDLENMIEPLTNANGKTLTKAETREILIDSFDAITTGGASRIDPGVKGGKKLGNTKQESRAFEFKDADSWLAYQDKYGSKDIFTMTQDFLRAMSQDTALMEVMGPNPNATFSFLQDLQAKEGVGARTRQFQEAVFKEQTGIGSIENIGRAASIMGATRNVISSSLLGGAWISAWSDTFFLAQSARFNGLPVGKVLKRMAKNVSSTGNTKDAVKTGLIAEAWLSRSIGANRYTEVFGKGVTAKISDFVMRASLLAPWTEAGRTAFGMEFTSFLATQAGKSFNDLSPPIKNALGKAGIGDVDWNVIRKAKQTDIDGVKFLASEAIQGLDIPATQKNDLTARYMGMILQEGDVAVPTPDSRARAAASLGTQKGTLIGELTRTGIMFKSFPVTLVTTHFYRAFMQSEKLDRLSYLGAMLVGTTAIGALSVQAKDIVKGGNPRDMSEGRFWSAAAMQGGGLGILGDFFFSDQNRFGGSFSSSLFGPALSLIDDTAKLTIGNLQQAAKGEDTNLAGESIKFASRYTPGNSLWYTRLAVERAIVDQLAQAADPKMAKKFNNAVKRRRKNYGSSYWWKPGKAKPDNAPDFSKITGKK